MVVGEGVGRTPRRSPPLDEITSTPKLLTFGTLDGRTILDSLALPLVREVRVLVRPVSPLVFDLKSILGINSYRFGQVFILVIYDLFTVLFYVVLRFCVLGLT